MIHQTPILGQEYDPSTEKTFADCNKCGFSELKKDGTRMCIVKSIDCSVREGKMPCTKYEV